MNREEPHDPDARQRAPSLGTRTTRNERLARQQELFPDGIPKLWCPTLTHFQSSGELDESRIRQHLQHLSPHVRAILVPGSTGEGWEMKDEDIQALLPIVLDVAGQSGIGVLVGVLRHTTEDMLRSIVDTCDWLRTRTGTETNLDALAASGVIGFAACPPKGASLSQQVIRSSLAEVLSLDLPTALYQLPQVTENEMSPQTVEALTHQFPNLLFFKDTSGKDRVAGSNLDFGGVFFVRGAEGNYARMTRNTGGRYDGLLLSTANVFAVEFAEILRQVGRGSQGDAKELSDRVQQVVEQTFELVSDFETGNAFTNANKVLDHIMAYGPKAIGVAPPLLYSGVRLPSQFIETTIENLKGARLLPECGYLQA